MTVFIRARSSHKGIRWQVIYRTGGRKSPLRSAGTYATRAEAERAGEAVSLSIAGLQPVRESPRRRRDRKVYIAELGGLLKIGHSVDPDKRCRNLNATLLHVEDGGLQRERELHARFAHLRVRGEFFRPGARGEIRRYISRRQREAA